MVVTLASTRQLAFHNPDEMGWEWVITIVDISNRNPVYLEGLVIEKQSLSGLVVEDQDIGAKIGNG